MKRNQWSVIELKEFLDFLTKINACEKTIDISDEIDCQYCFSDINNIGLEVDKNTIKKLPDCATVRNYVSEEEDGVDEIIITIYNKSNPVEVYTT